MEPKNMISKRDAKIARRSSRALELRGQGNTYRQIAEVIGIEFENSRYNASGAKRDCEHALMHIAIENDGSLHELRKLELYRYDKYLTHLEERIEQGDVRAMECAIKISDARAKILGLYAPVEIKLQKLVSEEVENELSLFFEYVQSTDLIPESIKDILTDFAEEVTTREVPSLS